MGLIDTHTHLESFAKKGALDATLRRAREVGVEALITIGTSSEDWSLYQSLAEQHPGFVYYSAGLHPCSVGERWTDELSALPRFWKSGAKPVALGEIGLDRFHLPQEATAAAKIFECQREAFAAGLQFAK